MDFYDVGPLKKIGIGHQRREVGFGWFLDRIYVQNLKTKMEYYVPCEKWLSSRDGDGRTFKEFAVSSSMRFKGTVEPESFIAQIICHS